MLCLKQADDEFINNQKTYRFVDIESYDSRNEGVIHYNSYNELTQYTLDQDQQDQGRDPCKTRYESFSSTLFQKIKQNIQDIGEKTIQITISSDLALENNGSLGQKSEEFQMKSVPKTVQWVNETKGVTLSPSPVYYYSSGETQEKKMEENLRFMYGYSGYQNEAKYGVSVPIPKTILMKDLSSHQFEDQGFSFVLVNQDGINIATVTQNKSPIHNMQTMSLCNEHSIHPNCYVSYMGERFTIIPGSIQIEEKRKLSPAEQQEQNEVINLLCNAYGLQMQLKKKTKEEITNSVQKDPTIISLKEYRGYLLQSMEQVCEKIRAFKVQQINQEDLGLNLNYNNLLSLKRYQEFCLLKKEASELSKKEHKNIELFFEFDQDNSECDQDKDKSELYEMIIYEYYYDNDLVKKQGSFALKNEQPQNITKVFKSGIVLLDQIKKIQEFDQKKKQKLDSIYLEWLDQKRNLNQEIQIIQAQCLEWEKNYSKIPWYSGFETEPELKKISEQMNQINEEFEIWILKDQLPQSGFVSSKDNQQYSAKMNPQYLKKSNPQYLKKSNPQYLKKSNQKPQQSTDTLLNYYDKIQQKNDNPFIVSSVCISKEPKYMQFKKEIFGEKNEPESMIKEQSFSSIMMTDIGFNPPCQMIKKTEKNKRQYGEDLQDGSFQTWPSIDAVTNYIKQQNKISGEKILLNRCDHDAECIDLDSSKNIAVIFRRNPTKWVQYPLGYYWFGSDQAALKGLQCLELKFRVSEISEWFSKHIAIKHDLKSSLSYPEKVFHSTIEGIKKRKGLSLYSI